ncbi:MAG: hypothetical protein H7138_18980 [Myxococcales bacterium]|nr:hypothetical protein [Myxococcales bacterium]
MTTKTENLTRVLCLTLLALPLAGAATAQAETPTELRTAILECKPSCYEKAKFEGRADKVKVCAYLPTHFIQEKQGKRWSKLERSSAMSPIAVPSCKFPTAVPAKWKAVIAEARKQLDVAKGDVVTVAADFGDWRNETDELDRVTARTVLIDHYSRNHEDFDRCRAGNPFAVCEGENNEVTSFNQASYRVAEAKRLQQKAKNKECRISSWDAVRQAVDTRKERERFVADKTWKTKTYATRYDGMLNEPQMFAKNEALEAEARTLWTTCGGKGDVPLD